ncbi:MAG TPA: SdpI family protein [Chloroflexota bacterium]|nr:SdpI family protein [Chloroflexota bacterium]
MKLGLALALSVGLVLGMFAFSAWAWVLLPSDAWLPVHWGPSGQPDRYGGKGEALLVTPAMAAVVTAILALLPRVEPRRANLIASSGAYAVIWIAVVAFLAAVHVFLVLTSVGVAISVYAALPVAVGALFIVIGAQLGKTRSNFFMGVRTPWTLSSELSWARTHRVGGRAFIVLGLLFLLAGATNDPRLLFAVVVGLPIMIIGLVAYSYVVWRSDPGRTGASSAG